MKLVKVRSYSEEVVCFLYKLVPDANFSLESIGFFDHELGSYVLYCVSVVGKGVKNPKNVLISGGVHGEEPAGVYTLLSFLENDIHDFLGDYRFLILPCINPFGFEYGYRFNPNGVDVNRNFKENSGSFEATKVMQVLSRLNMRFAFTVDLHETDPNWADEGCSAIDNPHTFYMWEIAFDKSIRIGDKVVGAVRRIAPVCDWPKIYGDTNSGGVIWYPEGCESPIYTQGTTLDAYLSANYTPQSFTTETPCGWDLEKRVTTNIVALRTILELKRNT